MKPAAFINLRSSGSSAKFMEASVKNVNGLRWRAGQYFPLLYSREAVENATERKIELVPETSRH